MTDSRKNPPVILTHGFLSTRSMLLPFRKYLQKQGFRIYQTRLSPFCIQDVRLLAKQLGDTVEHVRRKEGVDRVDIVGVSQGGVIGLYYLKELGGVDTVRRLVAVGTPLQGTWAAVAGLPLLGAFSKGIWQVLPNNSFVSALTSEVPEDLDITTISIAGDPICPPARCRLEGARANIVLHHPPGPFKHQLMGVSRTVAREVARAL